MSGQVRQSQLFKNVSGALGGIIQVEDPNKLKFLNEKETELSKEDSSDKN
jgi:hypothetical protein